MYILRFYRKNDTVNTTVSHDATPRVARLCQVCEFTCGSAELSCLWSTSLSWSTSWSLVWDWMRVSCVSRKDSSSLSLSSNIFTISCSKLDSASVPFWEPLWELTESPSFMVGITSHIILLGVQWSLSQIRNCFWFFFFRFEVHY